MHLQFEINLFEIRLKRAEVAELVDALGSGSSRGSPVGVRVSPSAPNERQPVGILEKVFDGFFYFGPCCVSCTNRLPQPEVRRLPLFNTARNECLDATMI